MPDGNSGFSVAKSDVVVCTYTNSLNTAKIKVIKIIGDHLQAAGRSTPQPELADGGVAGFGGDRPNGDFALDHVANGGSTLDLAEVLQDGYTAGGVSALRTARTTRAAKPPDSSWPCTRARRGPARGRTVSTRRR